MLREAHDPIGAFVLFEHVQDMVRSEAGTEGASAVARLRHAEDRYRLGTSLESHRSAAGMTQRDLADRSGVPHHRISEIENGCANPTLSTLEALTQALGIELTLRPLDRLYSSSAGASPGPRGERGGDEVLAGALVRVAAGAREREPLAVEAPLRPDDIRSGLH